jgi:hypothetical protein
MKEVNIHLNHTNGIKIHTAELSSFSSLSLSVCYYISINSSRLSLFLKNYLSQPNYTVGFQFHTGWHFSPHSNLHFEHTHHRGPVRGNTTAQVEQANGCCARLSYTALSLFSRKASSSSWESAMHPRHSLRSCQSICP